VLSILASGKRFVLLSIHQLLQILDALLIDLDLGNPTTTMGIILGNLVDGAGLLLQQEVDMGDLAADWGVDVRRALDGLDGTNCVAGTNNLAFLG
jgi:hypothetical protein